MALVLFYSAQSKLIDVDMAPFGNGGCLDDVSAHLSPECLHDFADSDSKLAELLKEVESNHNSSLNADYAARGLQLYTHFYCQSACTADFAKIADYFSNSTSSKCKRVGLIMDWYCHKGPNDYCLGEALASQVLERIESGTLLGNVSSKIEQNPYYVPSANECNAATCCLYEYFSIRGDSLEDGFFRVTRALDRCLPPIQKTCPTASQSNSANIDYIIGGSIAAAFILVAAFVGFWLYRKRSKKTAKDIPMNITTRAGTGNEYSGMKA